jgi:hypothetical protein
MPKEKCRNALVLEEKRARNGFEKFRYKMENENVDRHQFQL